MAGVPLADPLRILAPEKEAIERALAGILESGSLILGERVESFELAFGTFLAPHGPRPSVVGVGNGTDALTIALSALEVSAGSEVLVPANDGGFAASAVRAVGCLPVAVDVDPESQLVTPGTLEDAFTPSTSAVVVTHLHGQPVDVAPVAAWCTSNRLLLVEDAAQAHGATVGGRRVGTLTDAAAFSFYPTKNLGALGDGGAAVFADQAVADRARQLRQYGWGDRFRIDLPGGQNSRLDAVQAAVLEARLPWLDANNARRAAIVGRYREALTGSGAVVLGDGPGSVGHHAVVMHPERDSIQGLLAEHSIATDVHYPWLVTEMPGLALASRPLPAADRGRRVKLSLPCFPTLTGSELDQVSTALAKWAKQHG